MYTLINIKFINLQIKTNSPPQPTTRRTYINMKRTNTKGYKDKKKKDALVQAEIEELRLKLLQMEQQQEQDKESIQKLTEDNHRYKETIDKFEHEKINQPKQRMSPSPIREKIIESRLNAWAATKIQAAYRSRLGKARFKKIVAEMVNKFDQMEEDHFLDKYNINDDDFTFASKDESNNNNNDTTAFKYKKGDHVEAKVSGWTKYYGGEITRVNDDGTYDIKFGDGECKRGVKTSKIKSKTKTIIVSTTTDEETVVTDIFNKIDPKNDGFISRRNFLRALQLDAEVQEHLSSNNQLKKLLHSKTLKREFEDMDENDDQKISKEELINYLTPRLKDPVKNEDINAVNDEGDTELDVAIREKNSENIQELENNGAKTSNDIAVNGDVHRHEQETYEHTFKHKKIDRELDFEDDLSSESSSDDLEVEDNSLDDCLSSSSDDDDDSD